MMIMKMITKTIGTYPAQYYLYKNTKRRRDEDLRPTSAESSSDDVVAARPYIVYQNSHRVREQSPSTKSHRVRENSPSTREVTEHEKSSPGKYLQDGPEPSIDTVFYRTVIYID